MTRGRAVFAIASILVVLTVASGTFSKALAREKSSEDSLYKSLSIFTEVLNLIRRTYVDETAVDRLFAGALDGTTDALDSLSTFVPSTDVERYRRTREIGDGHSGITVVKERGVAYVLSVAPGSPAAEIGLKRGDALAQIDGRRTRGMPLWEIQTALAGEPGTELALEVVHAGQGRDEVLPLAAFEPAAPAMRLEDGVSVLRLSRLEEKTASQIEFLLAKLSADKADNLIIDLRGVVGGSSEASFAVADLFVTGRMGVLLKRSETLETFESKRSPMWEGRLLVLVDRATQGASEVLASVLEQSAGAELMGERTFGHAGRLTGVRLSNGGELFVTDAFYAGPDDAPIYTAIEPALVVSEGNRRLSEAGVPLEELILRRAVERLLGEESPLEDVA